MLDISATTKGQVAEERKFLICQLKLRKSICTAYTFRDEFFSDMATMRLKFKSAFSC